MNDKIRLTRPDGRPIWIHPEWIAKLHPHDAYVRVFNHQGRYWEVEQSIDYITTAISRLTGEVPIHV